MYNLEKISLACTFQRSLENFQYTVEPRNSVPRNSDFPRYSEFLPLADRFLI